MRGQIGVSGIRHGALSSVLKTSLMNYTTCLKIRCERNNLVDQQPNEAIRLASQFGNYFWHHGSVTAVKGIQGKYELASGRVE